MYVFYLKPCHEQSGFDMLNIAFAATGDLDVFHKYYITT